MPRRPRVGRGRGAGFPASDCWVRAAGSLLLAVLAAAWLAGCGGEHTVPVPIENVGTNPGTEESMALDLDARGYVNGVLQPENIDVKGNYHYPVFYVGSWTLIRANTRQGWYMATCGQAGAVVNVVGTMTRVIFDLWDYRQYEDPGRVSFWLDGVKLTEFDLARSNAAGQAIMDYVVFTGKTTVSTVTMRLESGRTVIAGYRFIFPEKTPAP
ncbi:MAG: hypothetical protein GX442_02870 [Candidatus Riflebacteria bacterium]|nr:hypothetical protein [Candidatus Riflebacteria bacterium]